MTKVVLISTNGEKHLHIGCVPSILPAEKSMVTEFKVDKLYLTI